MVFPEQKSRFATRRYRAGVPIMVQWKQIQPGTTTLPVRSLALLSGLRIWCCCVLWCRLQMWAGSGIAVAVAVV